MAIDSTTAVIRANKGGWTRVAVDVLEVLG